MKTFREFIQEQTELVERDSSEYRAALDAMSDEELVKHYEEQYKNKFGTVTKHTARKDMIRYLIKGR